MLRGHLQKAMSMLVAAHEAAKHVGRKVAKTEPMCSTYYILTRIKDATTEWGNVLKRFDAAPPTVLLTRETAENIFRAWIERGGSNAQNGDQGMLFGVLANVFGLTGLHSAATRSVGIRTYPCGKCGGRRTR